MQKLTPVIHFGALGDAIVLTPLLQRLRERHDRPCLVIGESPWTRAVFRGNPDVGQVIVIHRKLPIACNLGWWRAVGALRRHPGPVYVCEENYAKKAERLLALGAVAHSRRVYSPAVPVRPREHESDRLLRVGEQGGSAVNAGAGAALPRVWVLQEERDECHAWLEARGWQGRSLILVQPGNKRTMSSQRRRHRRLNRDDKAWPVERWRELLHGIHARMPGAVMLLCGAPTEAGLLEEIRRAAALACVAPAVLDLRRFFALCEAAHSMISVDTGPAHAAAALGVPMVVMFGSQSPDRWAPRSPGTPVIRLGGPPEHHRVDQIPVDTVIENWWQLTQSLPDAMARPACPAVASR